MRLLDAELLKHEMMMEMEIPLLARRTVLQIIDDVPTIEAEPVRRGRWKKNENGTLTCSECQSWIPEEQGHYANYCLYCGAEMEDEEWK